jgi:polar amino acid transport system substrate-binding protein
VFKRSSVLIAAVAAGAVILSGCSSNSESSGPSSSSITNTAAASSGSSPSPSATGIDPAVLALIPAKIKSAGKLVVGVNVPYTPNEYKDASGKIVGFDVDLLDATAAVLGLKTQYTEADFSKIVPAVSAGTYDIGMSSFTDNKEREKTVDFVTYFSAGIEWAAPAGKTVDPDNACGLTVAVQTTTTEDTDDLPAKSKACTDAGKKAIKKLQYDSQDDATNAVVLGKADAMSADSPVTAYAIKQSGGKLVASGKIYEAAPYGWPMAKGSTLVQAMQKAVQFLMDNGSYDQICQKWGVQDGAIKTAAINGATS